MAAQAQAGAGHPGHATKTYQANPRYCEIDTDCAIREGACGPQIMNIRYDNSKLLAMRPLIECVDNAPPSLPLKCIHNQCVSEAAAAKTSNENSGSEQGQGEKHYECTAEARACPDGSAVGRAGPNCEFAKCPP